MSHGTTKNLNPPKGKTVHLRIVPAEDISDLSKATVEKNQPTKSKFAALMNDFCDNLDEHIIFLKNL